jgi:hypothetical protein
MKTTRNLWPLGIGLAFVLFFGAMTAVVVIAATHRESMVSENYYEQELTFQAQIDGAARAQKSGASVSSDVARGQIGITVPVAQLAQKFSGTIEFYRPSEPKLDREFLLEPKNDGTQTVNVSRLAAGLWVVRVKWVANGQSYFLEQKITVAGT